jgi:hypothetical protein
LKPYLVPASRGFNGLWECKLTPAYCTCQERNTTGCIFNNDGADAGVVDLFSTRGIHRGFTIVGRGEFLGKSDVGESEKKSKNRRHTGAGGVAIFIGKREACGM